MRKIALSCLLCPNFHLGFWSVCLPISLGAHPFLLCQMRRNCSRLHICLASYCWWEKVCWAVRCLGSSSVCLFISLVPLYSSYPFSNEANLFLAAHLSDLILLVRKNVSSCLLCPASRLCSCLPCVSHHFSCQQNNCHRQSTTVCCIILSLRKM